MIVKNLNHPLYGTLYGMIRTLTGTLTQLGDSWLVVEVQGVGYLVHAAVLSHPYTLGSTVTLHTYLAVRETALDLYGFPHERELEMFTLLLGIPKVGPKSALQILAQDKPTLLIEATQKRDATYLHKLSGIGKKTCENIVQYLQNKLDTLPPDTHPTLDTANQIQTDAIDALVALGYETTTAREAILAITDENATVNTLVTKALKQIQ